MSVLNPLLLGLGLAAIAAPILIHILMRRRRKPVPWAAMRFLLEAYRKQRRRMQLEQILLLALRCMLIGLVAIALARPILAGTPADAAGGRSLMILLDNSLTSAADPAGGPTDLQRSKAIAAEVLGTLDPARGDRVGLVLAAAPPEAPVVPPSSDIDAVARLVRGVTPLASAADWTEAVRAARRAVIPDETESPTRPGRTELVLLSAWRAGSLGGDDASQIPGSDGLRLTVAEPAATQAGNVWIQAVEPVRRVQLAGPGASVRQVRVTLARDEPASASAGTTELTLALASASGQRRAAGRRASTVGAWAPGERELTITLSLPELPAISEAAGTLILRAEASTEGVPDSILADNTARSAIQLRDSLRVGVVARSRFGRRARVSEYEPIDWVRAALRPDPDDASGLEPIAIDPASLDAPRLAGLDALVLLRPDLVDGGAWARLADMAAAGKPLIVTPPAQAGASLWADEMAAALGIELTVSRDPVEPDQPERLDPDAQIPERSPISLLRGELPELAAAVRVFRRFDIEPDEHIEPLLATENGAPVLARLTSENIPGGVTLFAVAADPEWSELPAKPLFVPLIQELVRDGVGASAPWRTLPAGPIPAGAIPDPAVELTADDRSLSLAAGPPPALRTAGAWRAIDDTGRDIGLLLVNHDPDASATGTRSRRAVAERLLDSPADSAGEEQRITWVGPRDEAEGPQPAQTLTRPGARTPWDMPLLALALLVGVGELVLARYASHAIKPRRGRRNAGGPR